MLAAWSSAMEAASVESNSSSGLVVAIKVLDGMAVGWLKAGKYAKFASWLLRVAPRGCAAGIVGGLVAGVVACSISNG